MIGISSSSRQEAQRYACSRQPDRKTDGHSNKDPIQSGGRDLAQPPPPATTVRDWNARGMAQSTTGIGTALALAVAPARRGGECCRRRRRGAVNRRGQQRLILPRRALQGRRGRRKGNLWGWGRKEQGEDKASSSDTQGGSSQQPTTVLARIPHDSIADAPKGLVFSWALPSLIHTHTHTPHVLCVCVCVTRQRETQPHRGRSGGSLWAAGRSWTTMCSCPRPCMCL